MSEAGTRQAWWRRFRVSLRALMVAVLAVGVLMGWVVNRARTQRVAVAAIERAGGSVRYEWDYRNGVPVKPGKPDWPDWLVQRLGVDYFGNVVFVFLPEGGTDAEMEQIGKLSRLKTLWVRSPRVTDAGAIPLRGLTYLEDLMFAGCQVGDPGIDHLTSLKRLRHISFDDTHVSGTGLSRLQDALLKATMER